MNNQYLVFNISKEKYIIEITEVREVITAQDYEKVPNCDNHVLGLLNLRSEMVTVIDSSVIFNTQMKDPLSKDNKVIIFEYNNEKVGLVVEKASRVLEIKESEIDPSPTYNDSIFVSGVVHREGDLYIVVDLNKTELNINKEVA